eukprot:TRINITY_DN12686_c0_g1_i1.p1 TRINITY_DN12686_c0_g1~~TRINITY_DN12686_c0_g1_i1.p1  ORF type:complete len:324 (+),score=52.13 TRINITY_DN12686_c0_g1_i1:64-1035(+)
MVVRVSTSHQGRNNIRRQWITAASLRGKELKGTRLVEVLHEFLQKEMEFLGPADLKALVVDLIAKGMTLSLPSTEARQLRKAEMTFLKKWTCPVPKASLQDVMRQNTVMHDEVLERMDLLETELSKQADRSSDNEYRLGLKIEAFWLKKIQEEGKDIEVRRFKPEDIASKSTRHLLRNRIYLLANGEIWGSFKLGRVIYYPSKESFAKDMARHQVPKKDKNDFKGQAYGWELQDIRWFSTRPRCDKPELLGQYVPAKPTVKKPAGIPGGKTGRAKVLLKPKLIYKTPKTVLYKGIPIPCFYRQGEGQVFARALFPSSLDRYTR